MVPTAWSEHRDAEAPAERTEAPPNLVARPRELQSIELQSAVGESSVAGCTRETGTQVDHQSDSLILTSIETNVLQCASQFLLIPSIFGLLLFGSVERYWRSFR